MSTITPSYHYRTAGRTYHLLNLTKGLARPPPNKFLKQPDPPPDPTRKYTVLSPSVSYMQVDDVGALIGVGTSRLPLRRRERAEFMWSLFRLLDVGDAALDVVQVACVQADLYERTASQ